MVGSSGTPTRPAIARGETRGPSAPSVGDAHALGVEALRRGRIGEALHDLEAAARLAPESAAVLNDLGHALRVSGRLAEALAAYRRALVLSPEALEIHANLAGLLGVMRSTPDVSAYAEQVAQSGMRTVEDFARLATSLLRLKLLDEAAACYGLVVRFDPQHFDGLNNFGTVRWEQGDLEEAERLYRRALEVRPDDPAALTNLGNALWEQGKAEAAEACYRRAVAQNSESAAIYLNLGVVLSGQGKLDEARTHLARALAIGPESAVIHDNLGTVHAREGRFDEALACYERAIALAPDLAEPRRNRAMVWLARGEYERGWSEYEWRWRCRGKPPFPFHRPLWDGGDLSGRTILLHAEQGLGDTLQFVRYAPLVKRRGGVVHLICPRPLVGLLALCPGVDHVHSAGSALPEFDVHAPLMSLPRLLGTTLETIPAEVPYLFADAGGHERWREVLDGRAGLRVGVAWQGNPRYGMDRIRSFPLDRLAPLAEVPGVRLISLQRGPGSEQVGRLGGRFPIEEPGGPGGEGLGDFLETAALVRNLDLVVTPDVAYAHLAGGLGVRTWVVLPSVAEWRWLLDRDDCPWYPTARLFRQPRPGDWDAVFERVADSLRELTNSS